ncbi:MAG: tRNA 2-thiouridine(34) synthase MnmA [Deltaproteobacteria bacterium]|nr:MAG: tRNA 2-thiouridine(34) synthase MnmA [Deltaproteobacteria bacterium]
MRILCAMSGGVDSSVAAALLVEAGHEVIGMTMRLYDASDHGAASAGGRCCSPSEIYMARDVCDRLGIPHYVVDESERFWDAVVVPFGKDYAEGRTPNPCTRCNQHVKFPPLLERAAALGAERLATGHYARIEGGSLFRGVDPTKDQSYFLFSMGRENLDRVLFPLGGMTKEDVRAKARALGLPNADAPDSQELCFVPAGDHAAFIERRAEDLGVDPDRLASGPIVDVAGRRVGTHRGIHRVTVGQRRGLDVAGTRRRYVLSVVPDQRAVVVGDAEDLAVVEVEVAELCDLGLPPSPFRADVQIRHRSKAAPATVHLAGEHARVVFDTPAQAVAPGQAAVFYVGARVVGGGWIARATGRVSATA